MLTLFDDTEMFIPGTGGKKVFDLPDAELLLVDNFFTKVESDQYYKALLNNTIWREYQMPMYDKTVTAPRMVAWYDDKEESQDWPVELLEIRKRIEAETQLKFSRVLLNLYRDGKDNVAWHSDKTKSSNKNMVIASVTFGETRVFRLRHKFRKDIPQVEIPLYHGSFLLMSGTTNSFWEHQVPKTAKPVLPRINLTFRQFKGW